MSDKQLKQKIFDLFHEPYTKIEHQSFTSGWVAATNSLIKHYQDHNGPIMRYKVGEILEEIRDVAEPDSFIMARAEEAIKELGLELWVDPEE